MKQLNIFVLIVLLNISGSTFTQAAPLSLLFSVTSSPVVGMATTAFEKLAGWLLIPLGAMKSFHRVSQVDVPSGLQQMLVRVGELDEKTRQGIETGVSEIEALVSDYQNAQGDDLLQEKANTLTRVLEKSQGLRKVLVGFSKSDMSNPSQVVMSYLDSNLSGKEMMLKRDFTALFRASSNETQRAVLTGFFSDGVFEALDIADQIHEIVVLNNEIGNLRDAPLIDDQFCIERAGKLGQALNRMSGLQTSLSSRVRHSEAFFENLAAEWVINDLGDHVERCKSDFQETYQTAGDPARGAILRAWLPGMAVNTGVMDAL